MAMATRASVATSERDRLERRMERRWFDLAMAEERGQPPHVLDRMYEAYVKALDEFVALDRLSRQLRSGTRLAS